LVRDSGGRIQSTIPTLIAAAEAGNCSAAEELFTALYAELHRMARRELARRGFSISLGASTLLHETYLDMVASSGPSFPDRARFMAYAARVMRGLIIDYARNRRAQKRGGQFEITSIENEVAEIAIDSYRLSQLTDALAELEKIDSSLTEIIDLKFFCGFSFAEIAAMHGISERTVQRKWDKARIYLHRSIHTAPSP